MKKYVIIFKKKNGGVRFRQKKNKFSKYQTLSNLLSKTILKIKFTKRQIH